MSRYLTFDKIIIIKGVVKTSALNKDLGGGLIFFGLNGYRYVLLNRVCACVG